MPIMPSLHRHQRIGGEPADMALPEHGAGGDVGGLRLFDRQRHRLGVDVEAEAPMAVDHGRGRRFLHDGPFRAGHDVAGLDAVDIGRDRDDAVRVMAGEVGVDAADGDRVGLLLGCAGGPEQRRADARETVGLDDRHGISSCDARARSGSCLLSVGRHGLKAVAESNGQNRSPCRVQMQTAPGFHRGGMRSRPGALIGRDPRHGCGVRMEP